MFGIDDAIAASAKLIDDAVGRIWPDATEVEKVKFAQFQAEITSQTSLVLGQLDINKTEASNPSLFVSGWRPFIGWGLGVSVVLGSSSWLLSWVAVAFDLPPVPVPNIDLAWAAISALLGIGGMRSFEKVQGVDTKSVGK